MHCSMSYEIIFFYTLIFNCINTPLVFSLIFITSYPRTARGMDGTLKLIFAITETISNTNKFYQRHKTASKIMKNPKV